MRFTSSPFHAAAALAVTIVVIGLPAWALMAPAWEARISFAAKRDALTQQSSRYLALADETAALKQRYAQLLSNGTNRSGFLPEGTTALAAAALQRKLQLLVEAQRGELQSVQNVPANNERPFPKVIVRLQANLRLEALRPLLDALANDPAFLVPDNVYIQTRYASGAGVAGQVTNLLEVRLDVAGYLYEEESP